MSPLLVFITGVWFTVICIALGIRRNCGCFFASALVFALGTLVYGALAAA